MAFLLLGRMPYYIPGDAEPQDNTIPDIDNFDVHDMFDAVDGVQDNNQQ